MKTRVSLSVSVAWASLVSVVLIQPVQAAGPAEPSATSTSGSKPPVATPPSAGAKLEIATFGTGCFWCTEAVFERLKGVKSVVSGYSGGAVPNPTYEEVSSGTSGHAEVVQITYDPSVISFADLLRVFWKTHDPTTLNRQGNDVGTQYRSAIFFHTDQQRKTAEQYKQQLDASRTFDGPIVTEITKYRHFVPAEKYHQDYFTLNPSQRYCSLIIQPKVEKFQKEFKELLQDESKAGK